MWVAPPAGFTFLCRKKWKSESFFSLFPLLLDKLHPLDLRQALPLADFCPFLPILAPRFLAESVLGWQKTAGRSEMESGSRRERAAFVKSRGDLLPPSCKAAEKRSLQPAGNQITSSSSPLRPQNSSFSGRPRGNSAMTGWALCFPETCRLLKDGGSPAVCLGGIAVPQTRCGGGAPSSEMVWGWPKGEGRGVKGNLGTDSSPLGIQSI